MKNFSKVVLVAALSAAVVTSAHAASDGALGATSTGESDVTLIKDNAVQITNVADLDLGTHNNATAALTASDDVCVFNSTATYEVTVTSVNNFVLTEDNGGADTIAYAVEWADSTGTAVPVTAGTPITNLQGDRQFTDCNGGTNASFGVSVAAADFNIVAPGDYSDTLTLLISPE